MTKVYSVHDLMRQYKRIFCREQRLTRDEHRDVFKSIKMCLNEGWCADEIVQAFRLYKDKSDVIELNVRAILKGRPKKRNLLQANTFYYHNLLRLTSSPPKREIDYDSGEIVSINEEYFLEMRASLTIDELTDYYIRQIKPEVRSNTKGRTRGALEYLLKSYSIEELLFMIDEYANHIMSNDAYKNASPFNCEDYHRLAIETMNRKITESVLSGGNKIVRRKKRIKRS